MKVVIDTNILVSVVIRDRLPEKVLLWCLGNRDVEWLGDTGYHSGIHRGDPAPEVRAVRGDSYLVAGTVGNRYVHHSTRSRN